MSVINSNTFANKKPNLTGDLTTTVGTQQGTGGSQGGGLSTQDSSDHLLGQVTIEPTEATNLIILRFSVYATNDSDITIDDSVTGEVGRIDGSGDNARTLDLVLTNVSTAEHIYTYNTRVQTNPYQYGLAPGIVVYGVEVNVADTHATKNSNIISG